MSSYLSRRAAVAASVLVLPTALLCAAAPVAAQPPDDAVLTRQATLGPFASEFHNFLSIAVSENTAVVGASWHNAAYVWERSGSSWSLQDTLLPEDGQENGFGRAVAVSGDTIVVGAVDEAHVFTRTGAAWSQQTELLPTSSEANGFGTAVAVAGDTLVVGVPFGEFNNREVGVARVYERSGDTWSSQATLTATPRGDGDRFGRSVAITDDTVLVGAPFDDSVNHSDAGSAHVFTRDGTGWSHQARLRAPARDRAEFDVFGLGVSLADDTAVVGAPLADVGTTTDVGSAHVFARQGDSWSREARLVMPEGSPGAMFGTGVAVSGDMVVVGASTHSGPGAGSAEVFVESAGTWTHRVTLTRPRTTYFGYSVAASENTFLVTSNGFSHGSYRYGFARAVVYVTEP